MTGLYRILRKRPGHEKIHWMTVMVPDADLVRYFSIPPTKVQCVCVKPFCLCITQSFLRLLSNEQAGNDGPGTGLTMLIHSIRSTRPFIKSLCQRPVHHLPLRAPCHLFKCNIEQLMAIFELPAPPTSKVMASDAGYLYNPNLFNGYGYGLDRSRVSNSISSCISSATAIYMDI